MHPNVDHAARAGGPQRLPAGTLSGGERFRVALARVLLAGPAPQLLLLAEPTDNLDLAGADRLAEALRSHRGALIVAGHDLDFRHRIRITRRWGVEGGPDGRPGPGGRPGRMV